MQGQSIEKDRFFTRNRSFYSTLFPLLLGITLQNVIAYSVNMMDNIMLGSYSQTTLSGAAVVNQVFFITQQLALCIADALIMIGAQYAGKGEMPPVRRMTGICLRFGMICGMVILGLCTFVPRQILTLFTESEAIVEEGLRYLGIIRFTFVLFIITNILMASLRCVKIVKIATVISLVSLVVNVSLNYILIFGNFGAPELGIRGAAIATLIARTAELMIVLFYILKVDTRLRLFAENIFAPDTVLRVDFRRVIVPLVIGKMTWAFTTPLQTVILGHLSDDAIAANSVATTFYQYTKVVITSMASASAVMIGNAIGRGDLKELKREARTLSVLDVAIGAVLAGIILAVRGPLLSLYNLNDTALVLADQLLVIMAIVMVGMAYQMPVGSGIIRGGGDAKFSAIVNNVSVWCLVVPLSLLSAFVWKWPVPLVVLCLQSDQILKGIPIFLRFRSYKWIKKLTH